VSENPVEDDVLVIDITALKVREIEEIEDRLGESIDAAFGAGSPKGKALRALGFVMRRRTNPDYTWEDAGELVVQLSDPPTGAAT
jgi:hypothetical protein